MSDTPLADALKDQYCMSHLVWYNLCGELERELAALREDKARLDWLATSDHWFDTPADESFTAQSFRVAIDAARKEAQP